MAETTPVDTYLEKVAEVLDLLNRLRGGFRQVPLMGGLREFLQAANPRFPQDTLTLLDAVYLIGSTNMFPAAEEVELLEKCWNEAWGWSGNLRWKYTVPSILSLQYSPKKTGAYYTVVFHGDGRMPLALPLKVELNCFADMDQPESHWAGCELDDCYCEPDIVHNRKRTFTDTESFEEDFTSWLHNGLWDTED